MSESRSSLAPPPLAFHILRIALGGIFVYAAVLKIADPGRFLIAIRSYQLLPDPWAPLVALCLPWLEILVGIALIIRRPYKASLVLIGGMLTVFLLAIVSGWVRGLDLDCGCFGGDAESGDYAQLIGRDLVFFLMLAGLVWDYRRSRREAFAEG